MKIPCNQETCTNAAEYAYVWPGRPIAGACFICVHKVTGAANALGMPLPIFTLDAMTRELALKSQQILEKENGDGPGDWNDE